MQRVNRMVVTFRKAAFRIFVPMALAAFTACAFCATDSLDLDAAVFGLIAAAFVFPSMALFVVLDTRGFGWGSRLIGLALPAIAVLAVAGIMYICIVHERVWKVQEGAGFMLMFFLVSYPPALVAAITACFMQRGQERSLQFTLRGLLISTSTFSCMAAWLAWMMR